MVVNEYTVSSDKPLLDCKVTIVNIENGTGREYLSVEGVKSTNMRDTAIKTQQTLYKVVGDHQVTIRQAIIIKPTDQS
jgi:hypothetical protein